MLALGSPCPQARMAAGATFLHWRWAPPPARPYADARPRIAMSSGSHGRRRHLPSLALGPHLQRDLLRAGLARLLLQHLARVPDTFLLVRIRLPETTDVGRDLPHQLTIHPGYGD